MRRTICTLIPALALVLLTFLPAQAQERVQARGWAKSSYGRIIFDWPRPVEHQAKVAKGQLTVSFQRSMQTDLRGVVSGLGGYLKGARLSPDGKTATFDLAGNFNMETFVSGSSVVVDLRRNGGAQAPAQSPAAAAAPAMAAPSVTPVTGSAANRVQVDVSERPGYTRIVLDVKDKNGASAAAPMASESSTGEINNVPGMVGTFVAVNGGIPLITEDTGQPAEAVTYQGSYSPLTHYDPNATGLPRNLLLYDRPNLRKGVNGG